MNVCISQPMFLPWIGLFEQIALSDVYIHYDDVQMPIGRSFMSRVQIKSPQGQVWLTAKINRRSSSKLINAVNYLPINEWKAEHFNLLCENYSKSPCYIFYSKF